VLYELFTGKRPFAASTLEELFGKILGEAPAPPSSICPGLSAEIDAILLKMIAKSPEQRPLNWAELALDIAKVGRLGVFEGAIPDSEKFAALKRVPMLERLDDADLWELVHAGLWSRRPPRTTIVREGEEGRSLFFLGTGQVKVTKQGRLLNVLDAGECVGEMAYIKQGGITRQATVESMSDILLVEFRREALDQVSLRCRYQLSEALMNSLVDRLSLAGERLVRAR
jgi:CRP-like cAMP-binding protein